MKPLYSLFILFLASAAAPAQVRWSGEFNLGLPVNVPLPMTITQNYHPVISRFAVWGSEPFARPYNWMWRVGRWNGTRAWEFETIHHKLILQNRPDAIQWLGITHGFNTLTLNRAWDFSKIRLRMGFGGVLAHPESTVNHLVFNEKSGLFKLGYYLTGPILMTSVARPLRIGKGFLINFEGTITAGLAKVPIADGSANFMHLAFHLHAGLGGSFAARSKEVMKRRDVRPRNEL